MVRVPKEPKPEFPEEAKKDEVVPEEAAAAAAAGVAATAGAPGAGIAAAAHDGSAMMWTPVNNQMNRNLPTWLLLKMRREPGKASMLMLKFIKENAR